MTILSLKCGFRQCWAEAALSCCGLAAIAVLIFEFSGSNKPKEPSYQGKPLRYWTTELGMSNTEQSRSAIRSIGVKAVPYLLKSTNAELYADPGTAQALDLMGYTAVPDFIKALSDSNSVVRLGAIRALARLPKVRNHADETIPTLTRRILDLDPDIRLEAIGLLQRFGAAAIPAIPNLIAVLEDGEFVDEDANCIRLRALHLLASFGPAAHEAIPRVKELLLDPVQPIRRRAALTLKKISGENEIQASTQIESRSL